MRRHLPRIPAEDVSDAFHAYLEGPGRPRYGIEATLQGRKIDLVLRFLEGERYCCGEPGCHLGLADDGWDRLRSALDGEGYEPPYPLTVRCRTLSIPGAAFDDSAPDAALPDPVHAEFVEGA